MPPVTHDSLLAGRVRYTQPAVGYRVAVEAPLLARFAVAGSARPFAHAIDLGAGPGAIALMLAVQGWAQRATAVEPATEHAALARVNAVDNDLASRFDVVERAAAQIDRDACAPGDLIVTNPPYFEPSEGPVSPTAVRDAARAFVDSQLRDFVRAARRLLAPRGRFVLALPSARLTELFEELVAVGLHPKRLRFLHPRPQREAQVVFVEAKAGRGGGLLVEPPLALRGDAGEAYTEEADATLRGRWPSPERAR